MDEQVEEEDEEGNLVEAMLRKENDWEEGEEEEEEDAASLSKAGEARASETDNAGVLADAAASSRSADSVVVLKVWPTSHCSVQLSIALWGQPLATNSDICL